MPNGKLIVIEGSDGSGKGTQSEKLFDRLKTESFSVQKLSFPDYASDSSALVKMYLNGQFGTEATAVSPYAASVFYAVDRYASFMTKWHDFYLGGGTIIADRYVSSNMAYQAAKIDDTKEREDFLRWLYDLEHVKLALPIPDLVIFLDMPPTISAKLMAARQRADDIHERDAAYLQKSYSVYKSLCDKYHWHRITCADDGAPRSVEKIHEEVYSAAITIL